jgi:hypothetical protein
VEQNRRLSVKTTLVSEAIATPAVAPTKLPIARGGAVASGRAASADMPSDKQMQTFRMPRELVTFLRGEADRNARDLTAYVVRCLDGIRTYFGLPAAATALLEADRKALGMERLEYLLHVLFHRSLLLREKGPGFDGPNSHELRRR